MRLLGIIVCSAMIVLFMRLQTNFFGNTWLPSTPHEVLADGIGVLSMVVLISSLMVCQAIDKNRKAIETLSHSEKSSPQKA